MRLTGLLFVGIALPLAAQTSSKTLNLNAPAPRIAGHPDLSGVWQGDPLQTGEATRFLGPEFATQQVDLADVGKYYVDVFWGTKPDQEPLRPEAVAILKKRDSVPSPTARCLPAGVPGGLFIYSFKMVQSAREIVVLPESGDTPRQIYIDGRSFPKDIQPSWSGYSVAKWNGDALVVETTGFNEDSWLDAFGHPRSESMIVRETYRRRDFGHMDFEVTFEDPKYYTRSFGFKAQFHLVPDGDLIEYVCGENEKDRTHIANAAH